MSDRVRKRVVIALILWGALGLVAWLAYGFGWTPPETWRSWHLGSVWGVTLAVLIAASTYPRE